MAEKEPPDKMEQVKEESKTSRGILRLVIFVALVVLAAVFVYYMANFV